MPRSAWLKKRGRNDFAGESSGGDDGAEDSDDGPGHKFGGNECGGVEFGGNELAEFGTPLDSCAPARLVRRCRR